MLGQGVQLLANSGECEDSPEGGPEVSRASPNDSPEGGQEVSSASARKFGSLFDWDTSRSSSPTKKAREAHSQGMEPRARSQPSLKACSKGPMSIPLCTQPCLRNAQQFPQPPAKKHETQSYPYSGHQRVGPDHRNASRQQSRSPVRTHMGSNTFPSRDGSKYGARCGTVPSAASTAATPATLVDSVSDSGGGDSEQLHPDAYLLSSLEGPAVTATVAGVLRSPPKNPELVAFVLGNIHCLLGLDPKWESVLESLHSFEQFLQCLRRLDQSSVSQSRLELLRQRRGERPEAFNPDSVAPVSNACAKFSMWVNAICVRAGLKMR